MSAVLRGIRSSRTSSSIARHPPRSGQLSSGTNRSRRRSRKVQHWATKGPKPKNGLDMAGWDPGGFKQYAANGLGGWSFDVVRSVEFILLVEWFGFPTEHVNNWRTVRSQQLQRCSVRRRPRRPQLFCFSTKAVTSNGTTNCMSTSTKGATMKRPPSQALKRA